MTTALSSAASHGMLVTVDQPRLLAALKTVKPAINPRSPMPILKGVTLETGPGRGLTITAFDYEQVAAVTVPSTFPDSTNDRVIVPFAQLFDLVKVLDKNAPVALRSDDRRLYVEAGKVASAITLLNADDYPALPPVTGKSILNRATAADLQALTDVLIATGRDDLLPVLTGVHLSCTDGQVIAAATDRYRLAVLETGLKGTKEFDGKSALVPARFLKHALKALGKSTVPVKAQLSGNRSEVPMLHLTTEQARFSTRLIEGEFPRYRSLLPQPNELPVQISIPEPKIAVVAVKQVETTCMRQSPVGIDLTPTGPISITSKVHERAGDDDPTTTTGFPGTAEGVEHDTRWAFNPGFLRDALNSFLGGPVTVHLNATPTRPVLFTGDAKPGLTSLLMPVRLP